MPRGGTLSSLGSSFEELIQGANQAREATVELRGELNNVQRETTRNAQMISAVIDALTGNMTGIRQEIEKVVAGINSLSSATSQNRQAVERETATIDDLWEAYKKMGVEVDELNLNLKTLTFTEKEINKVVQLGTAYNKQREDSYTALSEKYRAVKILIDNMTIAERENTAEGRAFVAMARDMYEQMNLLQQRTGKYQLQVGDYSKAMTGLNIATNQVIRELPVLANGVSMFAIAISNNIPILVDNIMQVKRSNEAYEAQRAELLKNAAAYEAAGDAAAAAAARESAAGIKTTSVFAALGKAFFSWQTAIVLVLTVLPTLIRNIEKKRKAQEDDNKATKEAIEYEKILAQAYKERDKEEVKSISRLQVLYNITQDNTRANEDRIKAARIMKQEYQDEFANVSEMEIVLGKAKDAYDRLTESLVTQAKARAYLNKITALQEQIIDQQSIRDQAKASKDAADAEVARWNAALNAQIELGNTGEGLSYFSNQLAKATKRQEEASSAFMQADMPLQELDNAILKLQKDIPVDGLFAEILGGRGGGKDALTKLPDYFWDALAKSANALQSTLDRDLAILEAGWLKEQNAYLANLNKLNEMRENANAEERNLINEQIDYILYMMRDGQAKFEAEQQRIIRERIASYKEEVADEGDLDQERINAIARRLNEERVLRTQAAYQVFELSERSAADKEKLDETLRSSERQYWEEYLADLREAGLLTIQEYNNIMSQLAKVTKDGESRMSRGRKGRRYGGIAEALLAQTSTFGEQNKFGIRIIQEEYQDFVTSIDNALKTSMKYMDEWMDKRMEMANVAVEAAEKEVEAARSALDYELEARANGYANSVETARMELEMQRENHRKALDEQRRLQSEQLIMDSISQTSSLITATANIWEAMTKGTGFFGPALAVAATTLMWGSFAASKVRAAQLSQMRSEQYAEGTVELLEGGSHASGHDIDMGVKKDGTRRRAEGGEFFAIINKRNSRKYRGVIPDVIKSFNDGTFGEKYYSANQAMGDFALGLLAGNSPTDVSKLERDVRAIREQGDEHRYVDSKGNTIIRYKNLTRKIKI